MWLIGREGRTDKAVEARLAHDRGLLAICLRVLWVCTPVGAGVNCLNRSVKRLTMGSEQFRQADPFIDLPQAIRSDSSLLNAPGSLKAMQRALSIWGAAVIALGLILAACGETTNSGSQTEYSGIIFNDSRGSQLCGALAESFPPQCGEPIIELGDLRLDDVVALQSAQATSWTDYVAGVGGDEADGVLTSVVLTDPVVTNAADGFVLRVADLGITSGAPIVLPTDVRNATDEDAALTFTSGQRVELTLSQDGEERYRWSATASFIQSIEEVTLPAGQVFGRTLITSPVDLPPGTYTAQAWITAAETTDLVVEWTTEVR